MKILHKHKIRNIKHYTDIDPNVDLKLPNVYSEDITIENFSKN